MSKVQTLIDINTLLWIVRIDNITTVTQAEITIIWEIATAMLTSSTSSCRIFEVVIRVQSLVWTLAHDDRPNSMQKLKQAFAEESNIWQLLFEVGPVTFYFVLAFASLMTASLI